MQIKNIIFSDKNIVRWIGGLSVSRIVIGSLSVLAGGALGTALIYFYTKENMWEGGRDNFLPIDASQADWNLVFGYFQTNKSSITDEELKKINNLENLKNWCESKYKETFSSLFHMTNWMQLSEMKKACMLPIKEKLKNSNKKLISTQEDININKLKNHKDDNSQYKLTYILEGIRKEPNDQQLLFKWCQEIANHGYQGEDSNIYKLVEGLCLQENK